MFSRFSATFFTDPGQWFSAKKTCFKIDSLQTSKSGVGFFRPPGARALPPEARAAFLLPCKGRFHRNHKENEPTVSNFRRVRRCPGRDSGFQQTKVTIKFANRNSQKTTHTTNQSHKPPTTKHASLIFDCALSKCRCRPRQTWPRP